ncbi:DUF2877 domain-containing protein [Ralstonia pickettii]|nr:DUF2877 domain-containing protein [Ralstonia pickettii]
MINTHHISQINQMDSHLSNWLAGKQAGEQIGKVHSVFKRVVNFITHDGTFLFSIAKSDVIQSPRMMKTSDNQGFIRMYSTLQPGNLVCLIENKQLKVNNWQLDFSNARMWNGDIDKLNKNKPKITMSHLSLINNFIYKNGETRGIFSAWKSFNDPSWNVPEEVRKDLYYAHFLTGLELLEQEVKDIKLERFIGRFVGAGVGLTPSGDDFLTGLLAAWQYFDFSLYKDFAIHPDALMKKIYGRTTDVSYFMLKHCIEGEVNQVILDIMENLDGCPVHHLQEALKIGSTSGTDMLIGLSVGYQQLVNYKEEK